MNETIETNPIFLASGSYTSSQNESVISLDSPTLIDEEMTSDEHVENASDALFVCMNRKGMVDIEYIASLCGISKDEVIQELSCAIYLNPSKFDGNIYEGWETSDAYLCGNLGLKYEQAVKANEAHHGLFDNNIHAIRSIIGKMPKVEAKDIYVTLGTPWLTPIAIKNFIYLELGTNCKVKHDSATGSWSITDYCRYGAKLTVQYGTRYINAIEIINKTLNQIPIVVNTLKTHSLNEKPSRNDNETLVALEKQKLIIETFERWVKSTKERCDYIEREYNKRYGFVVARKFDGSFLKMKDSNPEIKLFDYQKNAIARIILSPNVLLAGDCGTGKTYEIIGAAHEMKRMGLAHKNLIVVPNPVISQWKSMYKTLYPNADILVVDPKSFVPSKRNNVLNQIIYNDFDAIIMAYSCFDLIPLSPRVLKDNLNRKYEKIANSYNNNNSATTTVKHSFTRYVKGGYADTLREIGEPEPGKIYFDDLGIDRLFVDEAHNFKNVPIEGNINAIGINSKGSKKCEMMMEKVHHIQRQNKGSGIVFATGTPITNSISDIYNMQRYLQEGDLTVMGLESFNSWIANFAELSQNFEIDVDTSNYRMVSRYSKFHNLPELSSLLSNIADFRKLESTDDMPKCNGNIDVLIEPSSDFKDFLKYISERVECIRNKKPMKFKSKNGLQAEMMDNMLLVTKDGRDAALDLRLIDRKAKLSKESKIFKCANEVANIYFKYNDDRLTQLVFCDTSTPNNKDFNLYSDLRKLLVAKGIPENEVAFIHDAKSETKKKQLFKAVNNGDIRVLIGSTETIGTGCNLQNKLIAIHHLDVCWRSSDMVQRESRIIRPGNTNKEVFIYRYITKQSFDAYSWQLLETKQNFISKLLSNCVSERNASDVDDSVLDYGEVKALAIGNPLIKERVMLNNLLNKTISLRNKQTEAMARLRASINYIQSNQRKWLLDISLAKEDLKYIQQNLKFETTGDAEAYLDSSQKQANVEQRKGLKELIFSSIIKNGTSDKEVTVAKYCGFDVVIPAYTNTQSDKFVFLKRNGKYRVQIGNSNVGVLIRLNNYLKNFDKHIADLQSRYENNMTTLKVSKSELNKEIDYSGEIRELQSKVSYIDGKLGVKEA